MTCRQQRPRRDWARRGTSPAGCVTMARTKRLAQEPGRPSPRPIPVSRSPGDPSPTHDPLAGARVVGPRGAQNKRRHRGRPLVRGTRATAHGGRESEGGIRAATPGNGGARGAGRAQAAVGRDGVTQEPYGQALAVNLQDRQARLQAQRSRHQPIRRVHIPKAQGTTRPMGMSACEDQGGHDAVREGLEALDAQDV